ncbi:MAG: HAMP domain-containing histidine kinase [Clostridia bacterium]|nr:HAMP domain-containing histidine kinase [Clostridia bacterium]
MKTYMSLGKQWILRIGIFLLILVLLADLGMIFMLAEMNGYTLTAEETKLYNFQTITESKCYEIQREWEWDYDGYSGVSAYNHSPDYRGKTHFRFIITDPDGEVLYSNQPNGSGQAVPGDVWLQTAHTQPVYEHTESSEYGQWTERYAYYGNPWNNEDSLAYTIQGFYSFQSATLDVYDLVEWIINIFHPLRYFLPVFLLTGILVLAVLWYKLSVHTGHRQYLPDHPLYRGEVVLSFFDRIPSDLYLLVLYFLFALCIALMDPLYDLVELNMVYLAVWACIGLILAILVLIMAAYITIVSRLKAHTLLKNTLVWRCCLLLWKIWLRCWRVIRIPFVRLGKMLSAVPLIWQAALIAPVVVVLYGLFSSLMWESVGVFFLWILVSLALYLVILYAAYCFRLLMQAGKALAEGNLRYKTDTKHLLSVFREHGENLNRIGEGMEKALAEKIKSERFKTELITNVSHDIKTPLTSIINYTDLLSREPLEGNAREYTEVLSRQSARLKKLIEDLIEASKASTGNIAVALERLDVCQIVRQSLGEYAERMESRGLHVVETVPDTEIYAMVDGRQLWRVLDNLYSNVCKYALEGTRVYVVAAEDAGEVIISVKNISRDVLTTDAEELTERFVQGDSSRASEGSGLGLNIAKSLTELQHGRFRIHCDGDLFRCDISFPVIP